MKSLMTALTSSDARTALIAMSAAIGALVYLGLAVAAFWRGSGAFDGTTFAAGWSVVLGASAAAVAGHAWGAAKADEIPSAPVVPAAPATPATGS